MTDETIECPHCGGEVFNFVERRVVERVGVCWRDGRVAADSASGGNIKTPSVSVVCRNCNSEWDEIDLAEVAENA